MEGRKLRVCMLLAVVLLGLSGCQSLVLNIASNNQLFNTRSQATGMGEQEALVEGGGSPTINPNVSVVP